jgi:N4-gp56 family major capsid protein
MVLIGRECQVKIFKNTNEKFRADKEGIMFKKLWLALLTLVAFIVPGAKKVYSKVVFDMKTGQQISQDFKLHIGSWALCADPLNNTSVIVPAISEFYDRNLLENMRPLLVLDMWGQVRPLRRGHGKQIKFRRPNILPVATTPLTEGVTPTGITFSYAEVTDTIKQYGSFVEFTDLVELTNVDNVLVDITNEQGQQAGETIEELRRDVLVAGTNVIYANGSARASVNTIMTVGDIKTAVRTLENANAKRFTQLIKPATGINTEAVAPSFWGYCHTDIKPTIRAMTGFIDVKDYPSNKTVVDGEIGSIEEVRFVTSTKGKIFAGGGASGGTNVKETSSNADIYATLIFGRDAYGIIPLDTQGEVKSIIKQVGSSGSSDPLDQRGTAGWKVATTTKILQDALMIRIESAATDALT